MVITLRDYCSNFCFKAEVTLLLDIYMKGLLLFFNLMKKRVRGPSSGSHDLHPGSSLGHFYFIPAGLPVNG